MGLKDRQLRAKKRLEEQLKKGIKTLKDGSTISLEDKDKIRISKEITILASKI